MGKLSQQQDQQGGFGFPTTEAVGVFVSTADSRGLNQSMTRAIEVFDLAPIVTWTLNITHMEPCVRPKSLQTKKAKELIRFIDIISQSLRQKETFIFLFLATGKLTLFLFRQATLDVLLDRPCHLGCRLTHWARSTLVLS